MESMDINKKISTDAPRELSAIQGVISYNDAIDDVRQVQIPPRESSLFGYDDNNLVTNGSTPSNILRYLISDGSYYLDMMSTYIDCEFRADAKTAADADIPDIFLDNGGIHSAIKSVRVSVGGMDFCYINEYAKWYNAVVNLTKNSKEYRDCVLFTEGDSSDDGYLKDATRAPLTYTKATSNYVVNSNTLTLAGGAATTELQEGDEIEIGIAGGTLYGKIISVISNSSIVVDLGNIALADGEVLTAHRISRTYTSTRRLVANGQVHRLSFHLPLPLFEVQEYFPLPLLQGMGALEVQIEFNRASQFLVVSPAAADNKIGYVLNNPRMNCKMVRPVRDIIEAHKSLAKSSGFMLYYRDWRHFPISLTPAANYNLQIQTNLNSVHNIVSVMVDQARADSAEATSQNYKSQSSFLRDRLKLYRYTVGGKHYPNFDYVRLDNGGNTDELAVQAFKQLEQVLDVDVKYTSPSIQPYEWRGQFSDKFILSTSMSKYKNYNCGIAAANTAIEIDIQRATPSVINEVLHNFLNHDCLCVIGDSRINIYR